MVPEDQLPPKATIKPELLWIWRAWHRLSSDRPMHPGGMGPPIPGRIPWLALMSWCEFHEMTRGEMMILDQCFAEMDEEYLHWWHAQLPPSGSGGGKAMQRRVGGLEG